jgi:hypothetical protein
MNRLVNTKSLKYKNEEFHLRQKECGVKTNTAINVPTDSIRSTWRELIFAMCFSK